MIKKKIVRRKEIRKEKIVTLRLTESDFQEYERIAIEQQIKLAEFIRQVMTKATKRLKKV
jgi:hypothetical protein